MASLGNAGDIQRNIELMRSVRDSYPDDHPEFRHYNQILSDLSRNLAKVQGHHSSFPVTTPVPQGFNSVGPDSHSSALHSRKRRLDPTDVPEAKRFSANASPLTPGTPLPGSEPIPHPQLEWSLPNRPFQGNNWNAYNENGADLIDLTYSGPPSPDAQWQYNVIEDPFAELETAFRYDGAHPQSADAYNQDWMNTTELAQFLRDASPANGGYAFEQQSAFLDTPSTRVAGHFMPANGLGVSNREVPYLPTPRGPDYMESDSDEYGNFPLDTHEMGALEKMLENVQRNADDDDPEDREQTPRIMQSTLKEYQKIGLTWLIKQEEGPTKGSILADEMGLGKTVQAIAIMSARPSQDPLCKTTLVIAPVALMRQWEKEIARHILDRYKLHVYLYWGKGKNADFSKLRQYDVVLTTYGTLTSEYKQQETRSEAMLNDREAREPKFKRKARDKLALLGPECSWYRIILDEAHMIKNRNSKASKAAAELRAKHRLCMTGTPMMNTIDELYPLLRFLRVKRYNDWRIFAQDIGKPVKNTRPEVRRNAMNRVQILLKTVMLRRQKSSEVDGQPILQLPAKHLSLDNVEFGDDESAIYKALEEKSQVQFNKYLEHGTISDNYACILVLILRLRQACCHPHLIKDLSQPATENIAEDELLDRARQLPGDVIDRLKEFDGAECPICFDADPNPTIIIPCGHTVCGVCVQKLIDPNRPGQEIADEASAPKCPHCRGQLKAKLITDLKHFFRVHCPEKLDPADRVESNDVNDSDSNSSEDDDDEGEYSDEVDRKGNLADFVVDDDDEVGYTDSENVDPEDKASASDSAKKSKKSKKSKGKGKARAKPKKTLAELKKESLRSKAAKRKYLRRLEKIWVPSAKISQTLEILSNIRNNDPTEKTLIFSQFTSLLDLVEIPLLQQKYRYQRYDGSMTMEARADAVDAFMEDPNENIMLVSLKAGNAGLNLWRASQVIMLDPFWNPFVEDQAVDRAHRMPQEREVTVHRVLVPETVEDRICALQDKKREIIGQALDEKEAKSLTRLGMRELKYLFGLT